MSYKNAATAEELEAVIAGDVPVAEAEHAGSADSAAQAAKVGDANVGSSTRPVYLDAGVPKQCGNTLNVSISGNAATAGTADSAAKADKLTNPRTVQVDLESEAAPSFDGSANVSPGVTGVLPVEHGGTGVASLSNKSQLVLAPASDTDTFHSLAPGTSGYILKSRGSGQQPQWAAPSSIAAGSATKATQDASGNTITAYYAHGLKLSVNTSTYVLTATLTNAAGDTIATATIDLPLEEMVVDATFDDATDEIVLELKNGNDVRVPVGGLVAGLATTAQLNAETSARQSADTNLQNQIDDIEDGTTKVAKATTADKVGSADVGSSVLPVWVDNGTPKAVSIKTLTAKDDLGYDVTGDRSKLLTLSAIAFWNGAYQSTTSNLQYCAGGAIQPKPTLESKSIAASAWTALEGSDPFKFQANVTISKSLSGNVTLELLNDDLAAFRAYGYQIGAVSGQTVTIWAAAQPTAAVTLSFYIYTR